MSSQINHEVQYELAFHVTIYFIQTLKTDPMCGTPYVWETLCVGDPRVGHSKQKQQGYFGMSVA